MADQLATFVKDARQMSKNSFNHVGYFGYIVRVYSLLAFVQQDRIRAFMTNVVVSFDASEPRLSGWIFKKI